MANLGNDAVKNYVKFMKSHMVTKDSGKVITHTLLGPLASGVVEHKGSFHIDGFDYEKFLEIYKKARLNNSLLTFIKLFDKYVQFSVHLILHGKLLNEYINVTEGSDFI